MALGGSEEGGAGAAVAGNGDDPAGWVMLAAGQRLHRRWLISCGQAHDSALRESVLVPALAAQPCSVFAHRLSITPAEPLPTGRIIHTAADRILPIDQAHELAFSRVAAVASRWRPTTTKMCEPLFRIERT